MKTNDTFSHEANEMHAGAAEYNEQREVNEELAAREREDAQEQAEAMDEARRDAEDNVQFIEYMSEDAFGKMMSRANE